MGKPHLSRSLHLLYLWNVKGFIGLAEQKPKQKIAQGKRWALVGPYNTDPGTGTGTQAWGRDLNLGPGHGPAWEDY
jgi:hypothetical protein